MRRALLLFTGLVFATACASSGSRSSGSPTSGDSEIDDDDDDTEHGEPPEIVEDEDAGTNKKDASPSGPKCIPSPSNYDVPGNNCDDDGDGKIDNVITCDTGLSATSARDFAKALGGAAVEARPMPGA